MLSMLNKIFPRAAQDKGRFAIGWDRKVFFVQNLQPSELVSRSRKRGGGAFGEYVVNRLVRRQPECNFSTLEKARGGHLCGVDTNFSAPIFSNIRLSALCCCTKPWQN